MIYVNELIPPRKMSGLSSFAVTMDKYNPAVYEIICKLTVNYYADKLKDKGPYYYWDRDGFFEISCVDLKKFLDQATKIDDIQIRFVEDKPTLPDEKVTEDEFSNFKIKPFKHQIVAIEYHLKHKRWLLLDSMGLGKSGSIIYAACILKSRGLIDHCLILCCINAIKENWANEIEKFSNESYTLLGRKVGKRGGVSYASVKERAAILKAPIEEFFVITNIETIRSDEVIAAIEKSKNKFGMIAVDEIHRANNKNSGTGKHLLKLQAEYMVAATGSLITNSPTSAYLPLAWTKNDSSVLGTFRPQYEIKDENKRVIGYQNLEVLREEIESCSLRRTLSEVRDDMPPKTVSYEYIWLDKAHSDFYDDIKNGVKDEADKIELNSSNLLALTTRLRQASVCPQILTTKDVKSTKLERCFELVVDLIGSGEKVVILSNFVEPVTQLAEMLKEYNPLVCIGDTKKYLAEYNKKFQEDPNYKIIIGTHQKIGTGLTFNAASYLIMLDTPWTYSAFEQSSDRIYRVNNTRPAFIKVLVNRNTIDERILEILNSKKELADILVDGKNTYVSPELANEMRKIIKEL